MVSGITRRMILAALALPLVRPGRAPPIRSA